VTRGEASSGGALQPNGSPAEASAEVTLEIVGRSGVKLMLDPATMSPRMVSVIGDGWCEIEELKFVAPAVRGGDSVLELGGGISFIAT
jgi:hypothetical protein